jgi:hypothetical protein
VDKCYVSVNLLIPAAKQIKADVSFQGCCCQEEQEGDRKREKGDGDAGDALIT